MLTVFNKLFWEIIIFSNYLWLVFEESSCARAYSDQLLSSMVWMFVAVWSMLLQQNWHATNDSICRRRRNEANLYANSWHPLPTDETSSLVILWSEKCDSRIFLCTSPQALSIWYETGKESTFARKMYATNWDTLQCWSVKIGRNYNVLGYNGRGITVILKLNTCNKRHGYLLHSNVKKVTN